MGRLENKVAIVTGAGRGIGKGISLRFAAEGAKLVIGELDRGNMDGTIAEIEKAGGQATGLSIDVRDPTAVDGLVKHAEEAFGPVDILVNNAALAQMQGPFLDIPLDAWKDQLDVNLTGYFIVGQAVARRMVKTGSRGRVVNIGSMQSFVYQPNFAGHAASKGGVLMLTKAMAKELAPYGIVVNMIAPGPIKVERNVARHESSEMAEFIDTFVLSGRSGLPEDIAAVAVFLASDECTFVTGSTITVDGGSTAALSF